MGTNTTPKAQSRVAAVDPVAVVYASADHTGAIHGRNIGTETAATSLGSNVGGGKVTYR